MPTINVADKTTLDAVNTAVGAVDTTLTETSAVVNTVKDTTDVINATVAEMDTVVDIVKENTDTIKTTTNTVKTATDTIITATDTIMTFLNVNKSDIKRYGIRIDKSDSNPSTRMTYIHDAVGMTPAHMNYTTGAFDYGSWADVWFVKDNIPVMVKSDGTVDYKLNPADYNFKEDGTTASDVANTAYDGNAMSMIPLAYVSMYEDGNYEYIIVADGKYDDSYQAIAHTKEDGTIVPYIFLSMFKGSIVSDKLRSVAGQPLCWEKTAAQEITLATANGSGWYTRTWGQRQLINAFLMVMSKTEDSQTAFGNGVISTYVDDRTQYYGMVLPGTTLLTAGQFMGYNDGTHQVKVFHIEDWWGNQWERIAGYIVDHGQTKVSLTGPYNTDGSGYDTVPIPAPSGTSGGYIKDTRMTRWGRFPVTTGASSSTYCCDGLWYNNTIVAYAIVGGWAAARGTGVVMYELEFINTMKAVSVGASLSFIS